MTKPTINAIRQRLNAPGAEFRPIDHSDAWRLLDAIDAVARAVLEPPTLPDECPDLDERIIGAIEQLVHERAEARTMAHEAATVALRAEEEEAKRVALLAILKAETHTVPASYYDPDCAACRLGRALDAYEEEVLRHDRDYRRYSFLVGNAARTDAEEAEMHALRAKLAAAGIEPGWEPVPREPT